MNAEAPPFLPGTIHVGEPPVIEARCSAPSLFYRALLFPVKFLWGMVFCQSLLGSILVVGWTYRLAQRRVLKYWWKRSGRQRGETFAEFLATGEETKVHRHWPNWFF